MTAIAAAAAVLATGACNIVGPVGYIIHGPEKVAAQCPLDPVRSTVVFVDDRNSVLPDRFTRQRIAAAAEQVLLNDRTVEDLISSESVFAVTAADRFGKPLPIDEVGERVGADIVIYATVDSFNLTTDGQTYDPTASLRVKVIDVPAKARLWPSPESGGQEWAPLQVSLKTRQGVAPTSVNERMIASQDLADRIGRDLGQLFVTHERYQRDNRVGQ